MMEVDKIKSEGRVPSRNGRVPSRNQEKRIKGMTVAETVASALSQNGKISHDISARFTAMKKVAEEQRRKVRENREKHSEEEKTLTQTKKNEELKAQIQEVLDSLMVDMRSEMFSVLEEKLAEHRNLLKREIQVELLSGRTDFAKEIEKKITNGETFDARLSRLKKQHEDSFKAVVHKEYDQIRDDIMSSLEDKVETEKCRWENNFKRESKKRVKAAEEAVKSDFRVGLEDSQKQCNDILSNMEARTASLEQKFTNRLKIRDAEAISNVQESERQTCQLISDKLNQRDRMLRDFFNAETEKLRRDLNKVHSDATRFRSKICVLL